jgi:hypothetical protein
VVVVRVLETGLSCHFHYYKELELDPRSLLLQNQIRLLLLLLLLPAGPWLQPPMIQS